jgi:hypothetical protein
MQSLSNKFVAIRVVLCIHIILLTFGLINAHGNETAAYSFVYLGDIHFDKKSHHDFDWVRANKPNDIRQIEDYVRITENHTPGLFRQIQSSIESSHGRINMVVQGGDFTEGLCGSRRLQETQFKDALKCVRKYIPKTTFIAAKGNHDITGPGAKEAFNNIMLPWLSKECKKQIDSASFFFFKGPDLFVFFDAYHNINLDWLEKTLSQNKHRHAFVIIHPPVVPYNARSTWYLFSRDKDKDVRERCLNILGANKVLVLTAHLHKYHVLARKTPRGTFVQFSMNSVISSPEISVKDHLKGLENYGRDLVDLEPDFSPATKEQRQKILEDEKPYISYFEFANFPGYAVINVSGKGIDIDIYKGDSGTIWKNVPLGPVFDN